MPAVSARHMCLPLVLVASAVATAQAQTATPASTRAAVAPISSRTTPVWTLKIKEDIRWQQVTPAGTLLISTDAALAGVDIDRGQVLWEKPELGGLAPDSVRMIDGSLLMEAARPGLLLIFDPVTGAVVFDSRRLGLAEVVTRQRWTSETLFEQTEPKKKGLGGLMQGLVRRVSEGTALEVLQAGPDDSAQPRARVDLGKEKEPVYAVDDIAGMLFLRTAPGTLVGYRL